MKNVRLAIALALGLGFTAAHAESLDIAGSALAQKQLERHADAIQAGSGVEVSVSTVGSGKGLMDLVEGKVAVAAISMPLEDAVGAAWRQAAAEGKSLTVPANLRFFEVQRGDEPITIVTVGAPGADVQRLIKYLDSSEGRARLAMR